MNNKRVYDRVLLLLAIKPPNKLVDYNHIYEKIHRDCNASHDEIRSNIKQLIDDGYALEQNGMYMVTEEGRKKAWDLAFDPEMNRSYRLVYIARWYYRHVEDLILPFLLNRPISVVKVFSDEKDPINGVKPIFSRYAKQKPKRYNYIRTKDDLWRYIDSHAIDFIPYVHSDPNAQYPDWLVLDLDAGDIIKKAGDLGFELIKEIALETYYTLKDDFEIYASIKFSGSRGFQLWAVFDRPLGGFDVYRDSIKVIQREVEKNLSNRYDDLKRKYGNIIVIPITTSDVSHSERRSRQLLFDWSCMKKEGDVRAPWSMHWKTGLISLPVDPKKLMRFSIKDADPRNVIENLDSLKSLFDLKVSSSILLKKATRPSLDLFFG